MVEVPDTVEVSVELTVVGIGTGGCGVAVSCRLELVEHDEATMTIDRIPDAPTDNAKLFFISSGLEPILATISVEGYRYSLLESAPIRPDAWFPNHLILRHRPAVLHRSRAVLATRASPIPGLAR